MLTMFKVPILVCVFGCQLFLSDEATPPDTWPDPCAHGPTIDIRVNGQIHSRLPVDGCSTPGEADETRLRSLVVWYFPDDEYERALAVAWCESRWVADAKNSTSSASGYFQLIGGWWSGEWAPELIPPFDPFDPELNVKYAAVLWEANGSDWSDWWPSRSCWASDPAF